MRRIGVLVPATADGISGSRWVFLQDLALLGWTIGRNVRIDIRWAFGQWHKADIDQRFTGEGRKIRNLSPTRANG